MEVCLVGWTSTLRPSIASLSATCKYKVKPGPSDCKVTVDEVYRPSRVVSFLNSSHDGEQELSAAREFIFMLGRAAATGAGLAGIGMGGIVLNGVLTLAVACHQMREHLPGHGSGDTLGSGGGRGRGGNSSWGGNGDSSSGGREGACGESQRLAEASREKEEAEEASSGGGGGSGLGQALEVSVVVPTLNEEACIAATVRRLQQLRPPPSRIIVVDGGSSDATVAVAQEHGAITVRSRCGRALQLNCGAARVMEDPQGAGGILCFVHADTLVPLDLVSLVRDTLSDPQTVCGGFVPVVSVPGRVLWGMSLQNVVKTWYAPLLLRPMAFFRGVRCLFGDQAMFCRAREFAAVGGFNESLPIMEDADLCERLHWKGPAGASRKQRGRIRLVNRTVRTSGRRMLQWGPLRSTYIHYVIGLSYAFGASPDQLHRLYKRLYSDVR